MNKGDIFYANIAPMPTRIYSPDDNYLIGKSWIEALDIVNANNETLRVVCEDGEHYLGTADFKIHRLNLTLENGIITLVSRG